MSRCGRGDEYLVLKYFNILRHKSLIGAMGAIVTKDKNIGVDELGALSIICEEKYCVYACFTMMLASSSNYTVCDDIHMFGISLVLWIGIKTCFLTPVT